MKNNYLSDTVDIKLVITEHSKTLHKLSKTTKQAETVHSNSPLYSDTTIREIF